MSSRVLSTGQQGQRAPERFMVPAPSALSSPLGTLRTMPNTRPVRSSLGVRVSRTRLLFLFASQAVLSRGSSARQLLQRTVRAQR